MIKEFGELGMIPMDSSMLMLEDAAASIVTTKSCLRRRIDFLVPFVPLLQCSADPLLR